MKKIDFQGPYLTLFSYVKDDERVKNHNNLYV